MMPCLPPGTIYSLPLQNKDLCRSFLCPTPQKILNASGTLGTFLARPPQGCQSQNAAR